MVEIQVHYICIKEASYSNSESQRLKNPLSTKEQLRDRSWK